MARERDVWTVAALLVTQHGAKAAAVAEGRAADAARRGDEVTRDIWADVEQRCRELLNGRPPEGERVD